MWADKWQETTNERQRYIVTRLPLAGRTQMIPEELHKNHSKQSTTKPFAHLIGCVVQEPFNPTQSSATYPANRAWWRYQMEAFHALLALCEGNPPVTDGFPSQRPVTRSFDISLISTNGWANKLGALNNNVSYLEKTHIFSSSGVWEAHMQ